VTNPGPVATSRSPPARRCRRSVATASLGEGARGVGPQCSMSGPGKGDGDSEQEHDSGAGWDVHPNGVKQRWSRSGASGRDGEGPVGAMARDHCARWRDAASGRDGRVPVRPLARRQLARRRGASGRNGVARVAVMTACWHLQRQVHLYALWGPEGRRNRGDPASVGPLETAARVLLRSLARPTHVRCCISRTREQGGLFRKEHHFSNRRGIREQ